MDNLKASLVDEASMKRDRGLPTWKRALDFAIVLLLSPALAFIGVAVALVIKCGSPGAVLFRQRRIGYRGHEFICFKFRTMRLNAETDSHRAHTAHLMSSGAPMTKLDERDDARLIPLGAVLRSTGLDEIPQFINVLRGEMSVVGPRPCIPYEYEQYQPYHRRRLEAVPGLTGLWQVSGKNRTTFSEMIDLDIEYSQRLSLWLDLQIIAKTLPALWRQCQDLRAAKRSRATSPAAKSVQFNL